MFIVTVNYKKPLEIIDQYLAEHRNFLDIGYRNNYFIASGPKNPRNGGIIISQLKDLEELKSILKRDPFYVHDVADYDYVEFDPVKYHEDFTPFI